MFNIKMISTIILISLLSACGTQLKLRDDLAALDKHFNHYRLDIKSPQTAGQKAELKTEQKADSLVLVSLQSLQREGIQIHRLLDRPGVIEITDSANLAAFFVFADSNKDLTFQRSEASVLMGVDTLSTPLPSETRVELTLHLSRENSQAIPNFLVATNFSNYSSLEGVDINVGTVTPLNSPLFSVALASKGMWQPLQFMREGGTGVHMLQKYDNNKTPVLFVHGMGGAPENFTAMIEALDKTRYQPWIFSFPSGYRVPRVGEALFSILNKLEYQHHFKKMHLVAHSMGGLVSRAYLNECERKSDCHYLSSYTTLSTPWAGHAGARFGVNVAPVVMPAWIDMNPDSTFLLQLFDTPLPHKLPHLLLFSFRNDGRFSGGSSDGVIAMSSQLRREAQAQAQVRQGYNQTHVGILSDDTVLADLNRWLADH